ncbi:hypothetical protein HNQ50_003607 [Silvimonas terrae]|uniref:Uncharacterized protein n=1 Tax=Silvimonas terrae TaxID=300266 RepID=A0A840RKX6_9NEIS|nr:hypothetical protein [Silvimonas terrae]
MAHHLRVGFVVVRFLDHWPELIELHVNARVCTLPLRKGFE